MKKMLLVLILFCCSSQIKSQDYNSWSIDLGIGMHDAIYPLSPGYRTNAPAFGFGSVGLRYMFNDKFGLRVDAAYHEFTEAEDSNPFKSNYFRTSVEAIINAGNLLGFDNWTDKFNLLMHGGTGFSMLNTIQPIDNGGDPMLNFIFGFTPQFQLSNRISLFADFSTVFHHYQHETYDGAPSPGLRETNVSLYNISLGLNIALGGKDKKHADFWRPAKEENVKVNKDLENIKSRLEIAEKEIAVLKKSETGPNKDLIMTELDARYVKKGEVGNKYSNTVTASNVDLIRELLNRGYVNVYFDVNKSTIQKSSISAINYLKQFMMDNPYVSASLIGYADESGKAGFNQTLSTNRAKRVFDILVAAGISPTRLAYSGGGEDTSVDKGARQLARKVAFRINNN